MTYNLFNQQRALRLRNFPDISTKTDGLTSESRSREMQLEEIE